jgi:hypothetical protein
MRVHGTMINSWHSHVVALSASRHIHTRSPVYIRHVTNCYLTHTYLQLPHSLPRHRVDANAAVEAIRLDASIEQATWHRSLDVGDEPKLIVLGRARIKRPSEEQFGKYAAQRPHVDRLAVR